MIALSWTFFTLLALAWTGAAWLAAAATQWAAQALASGAAAQAARELAALPLPEWLAFWIDASWLQALQSAWLSAVEGAAAALPFAGTAAGWLVAAVWLTWGLGLVVLLAGGAGTHLLLRRFVRPGAGGTVPGAA